MSRTSAPQPDSSGSSVDDYLIADARRQVERAASPARPAHGPAERHTIPGYELGPEIFRGGQGVVYRARHRVTGRQVAVKILREGSPAHADDLTRFQREVKVLAALQHPNIVTIHDSEFAGNGAYYVMDLVDGPQLDDFVQQRRAALAPRRMREFIREMLLLFERICDAVNAAHVRGIVHRDLKPGNVRVDLRAAPHVLDFGLAKLTRAHAELGARSVTSPGQFVGSLPWASPEQLNDSVSGVDIRTDVYAIGVMLFQALTGSFPYKTTGGVRQVVEQIASAAPSVPRRLNPSMDDDVQTIVLTCLRKDPDERYQSAGEVAREIVRYLNGEPIAAKRASRWYLLRKAVHQNRGVVSASALFVLIAIASAVTFAALYQQAEFQRKNAATAQAAAELSARDAEQRAEALRRATYARTIALAQHAYDQLDTRRVLQLLNACPQDLRHWEWWYLHHIADQSQYVLQGHTDAVLATCFLSDTLAASAGRDLSIRIWDVATRQPQSVLVGHEEFISDIAPFPGKLQLASASHDLTVRIWDVPSRRQVAVLRGHEQMVQSIAVAPDGRRIASGASQGELVLWDVETGTPIRKVQVPGGALIHDLAFSPDGCCLASAGRDGVVRVWDARDLESRRALEGHEDRVDYVVFSRDGTRLASSGGDHVIRIWNTADGVEEHALRTGDMTPRGLAFSADGEQIAAGVGPVVKVWRLTDEVMLAANVGHTADVTRIDISPDGEHIVSGALDNTVRLWSATPSGASRELTGHTDFVREVCVTPDGEVISASRDGTIRRWSPESVAQLDQIVTGGVLEALAVHPSKNRVAAAGNNPTIELWDMQTHERIREFVGHENLVFDLAFSPDGQLLASAGWDRRALVWSVASGAVVLDLAHDGNVYAVAFSSDGRLATACFDGSFSIWRVSDGERLIHVVGHDQPILDALWFPDNRRIATASEDQLIHIWDANTGERLSTLRGHSNYVQSLAVTPDGARIASGGFDRQVNVWNPDSGELLLTLRGHRHGVLGLAFVPDMSWLASGGNDRSIRIWSAGTVDLMNRRDSATAQDEDGEATR